jgi:hypothetical protein
LPPPAPGASRQCRRGRFSDDPVAPAASGAAGQCRRGRLSHDPVAPPAPGASRQCRRGRFSDDPVAPAASGAAGTSSSLNHNGKIDGCATLSPSPSAISDGGLQGEHRSNQIGAT